MFGYPRNHSRTDFFCIMKRENKIRPTIARYNTMRTGLSLDAPAYAM